MTGGINMLDDENRTIDENMQKQEQPNIVQGHREEKHYYHEQVKKSRKETSSLDEIYCYMSDCKHSRWRQLWRRTRMVTKLFFKAFVF